jgi:hypothetical protein
MLLIFGHSGSMNTPSPPTSIGRASSAPPNHLHPTIYLSEPGVATKLSGQVGAGSDSMDMLSVAVKIKMDTFRNIKASRVRFVCFVWKMMCLLL